MKIYIAADHAGFELKESLKLHLADTTDADIEDMGAYEFNALDDFPDYIFPVAERVVSDRSDDLDSWGIIIGGSGNGEAIAANRVAGIRATVYYGGESEIVVLARTHNDANILSLGARFISKDDAKKAVDVFLATSFSDDPKYLRRNIKIDAS